MSCNFDHSHNYLKENEEYNATISSFIGNIFQSQDIGVAGYLEGEIYSKKRLKSTPVKPQNEINIEKLAKLVGKEKLRFEKAVEVCILYGESTLYTLIGAMGSGKTSSIKHILENFKNGEIPFLPIYINFNEGYTQKDTELAYNEFLSDLKDELKAKIYSTLTKEHLDFITHLEKGLADDISNYAYFFDFRLETTNLDWENLSIGDKVYRLYNYITQKSRGDIEAEIKGIMHFMKLIKNTYADSNSLICLMVYDNIDKFSPFLQVEILRFILQRQRESDIRCILPMRRSTYSKITTRAALSYENINQMGPKPVVVVSRIIEEVLLNCDSICKQYSFPKNIAKALKTNLKRVKSVLTTSNRTSDLFNSLSGKSIKIGLRLVRRLFLTNFVHYSEEPNDIHGQYGRSLLTPFYFENRFLRQVLKSSSVDHEIINVFCLYDDNRIDFLKIRILQLLKNFESNSETRRVYKIYDIISSSLQSIKYSKDDFLFAFNDLMFDERPLIGGEKRAKYSDFKDLFDTNDILRLTELGENYLKLLGNTRYIQEMLFQLELELEHDIIYADTILDRFKALREYLNYLVDTDIVQTNEFEAWSKSENYISKFKPILISTFIVLHASKSFLAISTFYKNNINIIRREYLQEIKDWNTLLYYCINKDSKNPYLRSMQNHAEKVERLIEITESNK